MTTYNALIGNEVKEMTIQKMFDAAYAIAEREGFCKVWNYDDEEADELIHCYKTKNGKIATIYSGEIAAMIA